MTIDAQTFVSGATLTAVLHLFLLATAYLIMLERKLSAWIQDRTGPNRVGFTFGFGDSSRPRHLGLAQPIADGVKFLVKEDYSPRSVERALFYAAPVFAVIPAMIGWAVIPWGGYVEVGGFSLFWGALNIEAGRALIAVADLNIGVLYILAIGSLGVYGVVVGAWSANNKYAFFGGLRGTAQMLSYEIPMGICVLCILLLAGAARTADIVMPQTEAVWYLIQQPLAAVLFFTCVLAETNRAPFDLPEAESELVAGYHTEYSSMKFALFFLGEYMHMITGSAFFVLLFLGGWHFPFLYTIFDGLGIAEDSILAALIKFAIYFGKVLLLLAAMMWIRWTLPRFRFDQLMRLAWRSMIPISLALLLMTGIFVFAGIEHWLWLGNIAIFAATLAIAPFVPEGKPVNRRVGLAGSRFSPLGEA
jgi:NADH-quinone oxidoreductase subunit H